MVDSRERPPRFRHSPSTAVRIQRTSPTLAMGRALWALEACRRRRRGTAPARPTSIRLPHRTYRHRHTAARRLRSVPLLTLRHPSMTGVADRPRRHTRLRLQRSTSRRLDTPRRVLVTPRRHHHSLLLHRGTVLSPHRSVRRLHATRQRARRSVRPRRGVSFIYHRIVVHILILTYPLFKTLRPVCLHPPLHSSTSLTPSVAPAQMSPASPKYSPTSPASPASPKYC